MYTISIKTIKMRFKLLTVLSAVLLAGCSHLPSSIFPTSTPSSEQKEAVPAKLVPTGASAFLTLEAQGIQVFRCRVDNRGAYYKFERPEAKLFNSSGEEVATLSGPMQSMSHQDGSNIISTRIVAYEPGANPKSDLVLALMRAVSDPGELTFNGVKYVQRLKTKGGLPLSSCSAKDEGKLLKVPYTAEYVFWK